MFSIDTKSSIQDEISHILQAYIKKHGRPPQIVEVNPSVKDVQADGIPVLSFQNIQKGLVFLGEEQNEETSG